MPYTPTTTFVDGNVLLSAQLEGNLDGMKKYLDGGMAAGDLQESSKWVDTRHIMKPVYENASNTMSFVTGFQGGKSRTYPGTLAPLVSRFVTNRLARGTPALTLDEAPFNYVQNTTVKIEVPRTCKMLMFQYAVSPITPFFSDGGAVANLRSDYQIYYSPNSPVDLFNLNNGLYAKSASRSYTWEEKENVLTSYNMVWRRFPGAGFHIEKDVAPGTYYVGLVGRSDMYATLFLRWSISVEAWID